MSNESPEAKLDRAANSASRELPYALVDVFAERALEGNMLAIFHDARGLSTGEMQALAREMNLAETTFVFPREEAVEEERGVQVRIFTTQEELRFAGHPTLGTAAWIFEHHPRLRGRARITLDLPVGPIAVEFADPAVSAGPAANTGPGVFGTMRQGDPVFGATHKREEIARATGIPEDDFDLRFPVQTVSTGMPFCIVVLRSQEALARLAIPQPLAQAYLARSDAKFFYCLAPAGAGNGVDFYARMQFYSGEDPATGSAAGCAIAYLVQHGLVAPGRTIVLAQGEAIGRPSRIHARAEASPAPGDRGPAGSGEDGTGGAGEISGVFVGGRTIGVARGSFFRR